MESTPVFGTTISGIQYEDRPGAYAFLRDKNNQLAIIQTSYGFFLPGGGLDPGETHEQGLAREIFEEIGYKVLNANFELQAIQYHWSAHYQKHFKKIGSFYTVEAVPTPGVGLQAGHSLLWMPVKQATQKLNQEFQRFAVEKTFRNSP